MLLDLLAELGEDVWDRVKVHRQVVRMEQGVSFNPPGGSANFLHRPRNGRFDVELFRGVLRLGGEGGAPPLRHQAWQNLFGASLLDEQAASGVFDGRLQVRDAFQDKPRPKRTGLYVSPAVLGPKPVVQHDHRDHLVAAKRLGQGRIVVKAKVVAEPVEGA